MIKYLGVQIPRDLTSIYDKNYNPITVDIKADLNRIEAVKMNILPRLLFFLQSLLVEIPSKQFNEWHKMISTFI